MVIKNTLQILGSDFSENHEFYEGSPEGCVDRARQVKHLYSNLVVVLTNRMLKLMLQVQLHNIRLESELVSEFGKLSKVVEKWDKGFQLSKHRVEQIRQQILISEMNMQFEKQL
jgi:hypothetical protein